MSELQHYFSEFCQSGAWVREKASECGCGGHGWFLSEVDTFHQCRVHYTGQPHPEDPELYEDEMVCGVCGGTEELEDGRPCACALPLPAPTAPVSDVLDADDIPF